MWQTPCALGLAFAQLTLAASTMVILLAAETKAWNTVEGVLSFLATAAGLLVFGLLCWAGHRSSRPGFASLCGFLACEVVALAACIALGVLCILLLSMKDRVDTLFVSGEASFGVWRVRSQAALIAVTVIALLNALFGILVSRFGVQVLRERVHEEMLAKAIARGRNPSVIDFDDYLSGFPYHDSNSTAATEMTMPAKALANV